MAAANERGGRPSGWNGRVGIAVILGGVAALGTLHTVFVVPGILGEARAEASTMIEKRLTQHYDQFHGPNGVLRTEMLAVIDRMTRIENKLDALDKKISDKEQ